MSQYFPKLYECYSCNVKVELDLCNYVTKENLKGATGVDTSYVAAKTVPVDLSKLRNVADNDVV